MKKKRLLILFLFFLLLISIYLLSKSFLSQIKSVNFAEQIEQFRTQGVPDFILPVFYWAENKQDGPKVFQLSQQNAEVFLINFWASWCQPCHAEFPSLVELSQKYAGDSRLKIVAISIDENTEALNSFLTTGAQPSPNNFTVLLDPKNEIATKYGSQKIPETYIVNKNFKLIRKVIDQQNWMSPEFLQLLERWLQGHSS